ncbi:pectin lyase fold/virulence factor [Truncatella angustata]|uniref:Pectin lyase fold/virulence factor n=1 Tax=Truncatella angustata TaxID=152316 RepID=A0A9P8ZXR2_9PEZI|nr:pectin lyase fold/virulence factor [Truncatella angustata]KAH6653283.1 pectin lyase fold/virulence factor [Truncatella angustata]KAH8197769.1 hypothetical protein TruAng_008058 [Truncatella angustata]
MPNKTEIRTYPAVSKIPLSGAFVVKARPTGTDDDWADVVSYSVDVADVNTTRNQFNKYPIAVASIDVAGPVTFKVKYTKASVITALVRPVSLNIETSLASENTITFTLEKPVDIMLEINGDKWKALHMLVNEIDTDSPNKDSEILWYFGPGLNNGPAYSNVVDGNLFVPSGTTVYIAGGAFLEVKLNFIGVSNASVKGHGFIWNGPNGGAILIERSTNTLVQGVTSLGATGFSLTTGEAKGVHIKNYRSFSSFGNGDGVDFFCSQDVLVEDCFLRNSDDTVAIYGHRWDYFGDTKNITIRNCTLLPDIAHPVQIGTHGNPAKPERFSNIRIENIDVLDHYENQMWYQGCISINAADENLIEDVIIENIRIEKISKGQLVNIRTMQNAMWTTAPGLGVRNITIKNVELNMKNSKVVNPSQILGYDASRKVQNVTFVNLKVNGDLIHDDMQKPRWYMVSDFVPMFINEHTENIRFVLEN